MNPFWLALQFLTRYPVNLARIPHPEDFARATGYFPAVGLLLGLELLALRGLFLLDPVGMHQPLWALLMLLYWVWVGDSLHLDGLADTCDALGSAKEGPEMLEVLHDPRLGSFGGISLVLAMMARWAWLRYLPMHFIWFLPLPLISSRLLSSLGCQLRPYAGRPGSLSSGFITHSLPSDANLALGWALFSWLLVAAPSVYFGQASSTEAGLALGVCGLGVMTGWAFLRLPMKRLGGISGDLLGYAQQIAELATAFGLFFVLVK
jgi:adenosylcobinamide-GDP ribazoletransferase